MRIIFLTLFLTLTGCGKIVKKVFPQPDFKSTHPEFHPYIAEFEHFTGTNTGDISVTFSAKTGGLFGYCNKKRYFDGDIHMYKEVVINSIIWKNMTENRRRALIFHELGHCALNMPHDERIISGEKYSVMHPEIDPYIDDEKLGCWKEQLITYRNPCFE